MIAAISGMGYLYTDNKKWRFKTLLASSLSLVLRKILSHKRVRVIVQNDSDYKEMIRFGVSEGHISLIAGSGVDVNRFSSSHRLDREKVVLFPARLLRDKGFDQFVSAASVLKVEFPDWRFVLAGQAGYDNPSAVSEMEVLGVCSKHGLEWLGHVNDMVPIFASAAIVCLPSYYREGLPKSLIEAAAASCAVVTTDFPGCRDAIIPGVTGDLVAIKDAEELTAALRRLILSPQLRESYGLRGRELAESRFSLPKIVNANLALYDE